MRSAASPSRKSLTKQQASKPKSTTAKPPAKKGATPKGGKSKVATVTVTAAATLTLFVATALPLGAASAGDANANTVSYASLPLENKALKRNNAHLQRMLNHAIDEREAAVREHKPKGFARGLLRDICAGVVASAVVEIGKNLLTVETLVQCAFVLMAIL